MSGKKSIWKSKTFVTIIAGVLVLLIAGGSIFALSHNQGSSSSYNQTISQSSLFAPSGSIEEVPPSELSLDELGFLAVKEGHFYYENGQRARFWGVNIGFDGVAPDKEWAEETARDLKALGINAVRFLSLDSDYRQSLFIDAKTSTTKLDEKKLDRMDYFIYCLKQQNISVVMCLYTERQFVGSDGVKEAEGIPDNSKYVSLFDEKTIALQQQFAQAILTRTNTYTGLVYADDPAIALYQITNENTLFRMWYNGETLPAGYEQQLDERFLEWLMKKYGSEQGVLSAWGVTGVDALRPLYKQRESYPTAQVLDTVLFYQHLEETYTERMLNYFKQDLAVKAPVSANTGYAGPANLVATSSQDFNSAHMYYDFIEFPSGQWNAIDFVQTNESMIKAESVPYTNINTMLGFMSFSAVEGMPTVVDEYNSLFPNDYQYETLPVITAYAAFQDWDGLFLFAYSYGKDGETMGKHTGVREYAINDFFLLENNAVKVSQMRACATMFIRGDVDKANNFYTLEMTDIQSIEDSAKQVFTQDFNNYNISGPIPSTFIYRHGLRRGLHAATPTNSQSVLGGDISAWNTKINASDTGQLLWDGTDGSALVSIDTPLSQAVVGELKGKTLTTANVTFALNNNCSAMVTSLDGKEIAGSGHLLVSVAGRIQNTGQVKDSKTQGLTSWGKNETSVEAITGTVTIQGQQPGTYEVWGLSANQARLESKTVTVGQDGVLELSLDGTYMCYEIVSV
ncbi:MAG: hypothetical protein ACK5JF_01670 [Oscillospiraceae bacterium]